jgi:nicotinate-nucleotide adenylyltransferase
VIPTQGSPFKNTQTSFEDRCQMLSLAIESMSLAVPICRIEQHLIAPVYSVDVFSQLRDRYPRDSLILLVGSDSLSQMPTWRRSSRLPALLNCWVFGRAEHPNQFGLAQQINAAPNTKQSDLTITAQKLGFAIAHELTKLSELSGAVFFDAFTPPAISSTYVRSQAKSAANTVNLVPKAVARYIEQNSVYF